MLSSIHFLSFHSPDVGRWGDIHDAKVETWRHPSLSSALRNNVGPSRRVHSLMLSIQLFVCVDLPQLEWNQCLLLRELYQTRIRIMVRIRLSSLYITFCVFISSFQTSIDMQKSDLQQNWPNPNETQVWIEFITVLPKITTRR